MPGDPTPPGNGTKPPSAGHPDGVTEASLDEIRSLLACLTRAVEQEHERASHRERIIDRLHEENQRLRHGELRAAFEPVRAKLYRLYDLVRRESLRDVTEPEHVPKLLGAIADELAEALARTGVERMPVEEGDAYDPVRHRPVGVREVTDRKLDGTIAVVEGTGFLQGEKVLRRADVVVARIPRKAKVRRPPKAAPKAPKPSG